MIDIVVVRGSGDRPGEDIESPIISTVAAAVERGRNMIDSNSGLQDVEVESVVRLSARCGDLVEVHDALMGASWRGKVSGVRHQLTGSVPSTVFTIERKV
jgi:hypothetical protein